ncbi:phosphotransferase [Muricoccus aerilatus]|uniref:phosphotransferase n=1 Tax=Muricoccus aerilatus TaxID=452982 RepID=UPI0005C171C5|nr:phosphotransferase [Roseomonas aerilata]
MPASPLPNPLKDPLILAAPPDIAVPPLRDALFAHWSLAGTLHPLGGERDRNFRLDRDGAEPLLVKLAHPDEPPAITHFQTAALLHLEAADPSLPVPRILRAAGGATALPHPARDGRPCLLRVLTYLPGVPMTAAAGPARARALGSLAARLNRALEGFSHPADARRLVWDLREAPRLRAFLPDIADPALRTLAEAALDRFEGHAAPILATLPGGVIHNDLNPHNVLVDPDDPARLTGLIDFGDMLRAPRLQEVATACAYLLSPEGDPFAGPRAFLAGYRAVLPLPEGEAVLLPALIATRMAMTVLITGWRSRLQPENAAYIQRNLPRARAGLETLARLAPEGMGAEA